jgi:SWI/SNF-related matrix-associated actin-dependent regulator 1 of chromatin subfamily A
VGITLTAASIVVFAEMDWTPGNLFQAEDRCHRIGQIQPVTIQYLVAKGTIDDIIWDMLNKKLAVLGTALDGDEDKFSAAAMHSSVGTKNDNELVSLVREKMDNYEGRKARMLRKTEIRNDHTLFNSLESGNDDFDIEVNPLEDHKPSKPSTKSSQPKEILPSQPFTPEIQNQSTSLSRIQKFRYKEAN